MEWHFENDRPIYAQLIEQMQHALIVGDYAPGQKLPGVRELAAEAGVNPNTMQRALAELEAQGLLYTQRTSGRFVTEDTALIVALRDAVALGTAREFVHKMKAIGCTSQETADYVARVKEED